MSNISSPKNNSNSSTSSRDTIHALSIKKGYLNLIPPLSKVEFELLKQSIKEEGMHVPIIINEQGVVLDGHHRFRACKELVFDSGFILHQSNSVHKPTIVV